MSKHFITISFKQFFLLLIFLYSTEYQSIAQQLLNRKISVSFKEKTIEDVIRYLQNYEGIAFSYSKNLIRLDKKVSGHYKNTELKTVFDEVFENSSVIYRYKAGLVVLSPKPQNIDKLIISGSIKTLDSELPVAYAGVQLFSSGKGTITDINGKFSMLVKKEDLDDSLMISSLGFQKRAFLVSLFTKKSGHIVYLKRRIIKLDELQVIASDYKIYRVGNKKSISFGSIYIDTQGQQTARFIENKKGRTGTISSVSFYLSRKGNTNSPFRLRIYKRKMYSTEPGENLLQEVIIAKPHIKGGWFKIDLSQFHVELPKDGFFVAIEGIYPFNYLKENAGFRDISDEQDGFVPNSISYGQRLGYSRKKGKNTWHYSLAHTWFQLKEQNFNVMISAEIQTRKK